MEPEAAAPSFEEEASALALACVRCHKLAEKEPSPLVVAVVTPSELVADEFDGCGALCFAASTALFGRNVACYGSVKHREQLATMRRTDGSIALSEEEVAQNATMSYIVRVRATERCMANLQLQCMDSEVEMEGTTLVCRGGTRPVVPDMSSSWFPPHGAQNVHCRTCGMGLGFLFTEEEAGARFLGLKVVALTQFTADTGPLGLGAGAEIVVTGVVGAPELNGQRGRVDGFDPGKGRYRVTFLTRDRAVGLKAENCVPCGSVAGPTVE
jgi:hypothetical protein